MRGRDIVVIGGSAGGLEALTALVARLPADLPAALFVVMHLPPTAPSLLPAILTRKGRLPAVHPTDDTAIEHGQIYVAPPDHHLLLRPGRVRLPRGPRENSHRPAVDPLFRSAAVFYGARAIGVVLSGNLDDDSVGLATLKEHGGVALVQDPAEASFPSMPRSALEHVAVDARLPAAELADEIVRWVYTAATAEPGEVDRDLAKETEMAELDAAAFSGREHPGAPSPYGCPECGGVLWEIRSGEMPHFRCRVGHAYAPDSLLAEQAAKLEDALWAALRTLEEERSLSERLARRAAEQGSNVQSRFEERARDAAARADLIRSALARGRGGDATTQEASGDGRTRRRDAAGTRRQKE